MEKMKKILRTAALFLLATIYCFAMNVVTQSIVSFNYNSDVHSGEERYLERVYSIFFYHTPHNETASNTVQNFVAHEFKNLFHFIWATQETIENKFEKSYFPISQLLVIHFRRLIFQALPDFNSEVLLNNL
jgi:uncharacterized membrane protein